MFFLVTTLFGLVRIVRRQTEPASTSRITSTDYCVPNFLAAVTKHVTNHTLGKKVYSDSQVEGAVHPGREDIATGEGSHWAHGTCSQEAEGDESLLGTWDLLTGILGK